MKVAYVDHMGDDLRIANALRRSFGVEHATWSEAPRGSRGRSDRQLVEDCAADGHDLPWRHCQVTLACDAPIPVARQLGKHQVGFTWSEISRRYKTSGITFYWLSGTWRSDVADRRQGSGELLASDVQNTLDAMQAANVKWCIADYTRALELGAAPEQARFFLPQFMEVSWTWTGSLLGYVELFRKRAHPDTQAETRQFAEAAADIIAPLFPVGWAALLTKESVR